MISKPYRIKDNALLKRIKDRGYCQIPECTNSDKGCHHIKTKGSGGDDIPENIARLCWDHHSQAHQGKFKKDYLRALALKRIEEEGE